MSEFMEGSNSVLMSRGSGELAAIFVAVFGTCGLLLAFKSPGYLVHFPPSQQEKGKVMTLDSPLEKALEETGAK
jgi:hypothetical protein